MLSMQKRLLVLQHTPWEKPGQFLLRSATKCDVHLDIIKVWDQPIPDISPYHGLIVLGGSPNADQEEKYPFLKREKACIRWVIANDMPYLGFCLGHHLLAEALGCKLGPNFRTSAGLIQGQITNRGRGHILFRGIPTSFTLFKWHSQAVLQPLPKHVQVLVTSADCEIEAISVEGRPYLLGLQFDNHAAAPFDLRHWIKSDREWLAQACSTNTTVLLKAVERLEHIIGKQFEIMFQNYLELIC